MSDANTWDDTINNGPHITVTDNIFDVQLTEIAKAVDFRLEEKPRPLSNGKYYNITGKTRRIKLIFQNDKYVYLDLEGSKPITFTGQARLIVTGPEPSLGNVIRVGNYEGTNPAFFRELLGFLPPGPPFEEDPRDGGN